jgi:hypothetical protein
LGERRLKDIDEPERVFELDIEGAPAPAQDTAAAQPVTSDPPTERTPAEHTDKDFGARLSERIQQAVQRRVEGQLERVFSQVDALADRAAERPEAIKDRLDDEGSPTSSR